MLDVLLFNVVTCNNSDFIYKISKFNKTTKVDQSALQCQTKTKHHTVHSMLSSHWLRPRGVIDRSLVSLKHSVFERRSHSTHRYSRCCTDTHCRRPETHMCTFTFSVSASSLVNISVIFFFLLLLCCICIFLHATKIRIHSRLSYMKNKHCICVSKIQNVHRTPRQSSGPYSERHIKPFLIFRKNAQTFLCKTIHVSAL